ncbi:MAG: BtpA/SgcQ family protein [Verrucomicrobiota bacterium]
MSVRPDSLPPKALVAVVAVPALPGASAYDSAGGTERLVAAALEDARLYAEAGADALLLENSWDLPYIKPPLPEAAVTAITEVAHAVRAAWPGPLGLQLLEAANLQALDVAAAAGLDFLRVEGYVFAHIGGAGLIEGCAGALLRRRRELDAGRVCIWADLKKKHCSHALTGDQDIGEHARQAELFRADGLIVTGNFTGEPPAPQDLHAVAKAAPGCRVLTGSGLTVDNLEQLMPHADGFIVGSAFRQGGRFLAPTEPGRLRAFAEAFRRRRNLLLAA